MKQVNANVTTEWTEYFVSHQVTKIYCSHQHCSCTCRLQSTTLVYILDLMSLESQYTCTI